MKTVYEKDLDNYLDNGWKLGCLEFSEAHCNNISKTQKDKETNLGENNPRFGDHRSYEEIHGNEKANKLRMDHSKKITGEGNGNYIKISEESCKVMINLYLIEEKSPSEIGKIMGFNCQKIRSTLKRNNIKLRGYSEAQNIRFNHTSETESS
jgi:predicted HTH domain antitoxin